MLVCFAISLLVVVYLICVIKEWRTLDGFSRSILMVIGIVLTSLVLTIWAIVYQLGLLADKYDITLGL